MEPESTSPSSAVTPAAFGSSYLSVQQMARPSESSLWIARATAPVMYGTSGLRGFVPADSMRIEWTARTAPQEGHRYNIHKLLLDPFATAISPMPSWDFRPARGYDPLAPEQDLTFSSVDNTSAMPKCVFAQKDFDWQGARSPRHSWSKTVVYETHVRGFAIHPSSGAENPGTYLGAKNEPSKAADGDEGG